MGMLFVIVEILAIAAPIIAAIVGIVYKKVSKKVFSNRSALILFGSVFGTIAVIQLLPTLGVFFDSMNPVSTSLGLLNSIPLYGIIVLIALFAIYTLIRSTFWLFCLTFDVVTKDNGDKKMFLNTLGDFSRMIIELTVIVLGIYVLRNIIYSALDIGIQEFFSPLFSVSSIPEAIVIKLAIVVAYVFVRKILVPNSK